jgi:hypothetical protein
MLRPTPTPCGGTVHAHHQEGRSYWSTPATATTAATGPSIPTGLEVRGVNRTSVTLAWQPPASDGGSPVTGYEVQLQAVTRAARAELGDDWLIIYAGPSTATSFSALHPGCSYMARVSALNSAGASHFSVAVQFLTSPDVPAAPPLPEAQVDVNVRGGDSELSVVRVFSRQPRCLWAPVAHSCAASRAPARAAHAFRGASLPRSPQSLLLGWVPPLHDGGSPVTAYRVEMRCSPHHASSDDDPGTPHSLALTPHFLTIYRWVWVHP